MDVLLFTDSGVDDTFALIYALSHPEINLIGIVVSFGNVSREFALRNIQFVLSLAGGDTIAVIVGADRPMLGEEPAVFPSIHGEEGLGAFTPPQSIIEPENFYLIFELIKRSSEQVTILNLGRLTSLAISFILHGELLGLVQNIHIMGGAFLVPGNITPYAEANIYGDSTSAAVVLNHSNILSNYFYLLNVTEKAVFTPQSIRALLNDSEKQENSLLIGMFDYYYSYYQKIRPALGGAPLHDLVAVCALVNPNLYRYIQRNIEIIESGPGKGITIMDVREKPIVNPSHNNFSYIAMGLNIPEFMREVYTTFHQ
ncbi:nucleoside hydrolase [Heyndrickxia acidicola]|uniref:Nucleoside hydrolase n=1 Tax=Heyndrickxia acidicola TaxID=209389 RepID=A0ABU6MJJ2_9BACI|nr:nucleoside hydrolase [Heyndrickxia acidicola]MED1203402.1 nucleoside hydrolase [Heyndrickxia acidicola]